MLDGVRAAGLKLTPQRIAIVRAIAGDPSHPTAQEIFDRLQSSMPTMSFATVYNTLDALAHAGLCGSLSLAPGPARFDPNMEPHHHAVCDGCGLVRDVDRSPAEARESTRADKHLRPTDTPPSRAADWHSPRKGDRRSPREGDKHPPLPSTEPSALDGFEVRAVEHIYRGLCADCASGRRSSPEAGDR